MRHAMIILKKFFLFLFLFFFWKHILYLMLGIKLLFYIDI